jgi:hypothetical protein
VAEHRQPERSVARAPLEHLWRSVPGAIVHHDHLIRGPALCRQRLKQPRQVIRAVVGGDDDGDRRAIVAG